MPPGQPLPPVVTIGSIRFRASGRLLRPDVTDAIIGAVEPQPVDLLRPDDLLALRVSFVNLRFTTSAGGTLQVERRARNRPAFLVASFPAQHAIELAVRTPSPQPPPNPPVFAAVGGPTRLAFRVGNEVIAYSTEGLLDAMGRLALSTAPHALPPQRGVLFRPIRELISSGVLDLTAALPFAVGGRRPRRDKAATLESASSLIALSRTTAAAAHLQRRFGTESALSALAGSSLAGRLVLGDLVGGLGNLGDLLPPTTPLVPREPTDQETAIELPWRLLLSPNDAAAWAHSRSTVEREGRVELWHTRLGVRTTTGGTPGVDEDSTATRAVRAIWTRDLDQFPFDPTANAFPPADGSADTLQTPSDQPVPLGLTSLNSSDRIMLVHQTSNFSLKVGGVAWPPNAVPVSRLMLSTLGGWLDSRVVFDTLPEPTGLSIKEWKHMAGLGRDHSVKVVYAGFLLPFGHKAVLVKLTERKFAADKPGRPAYLFQREFLVVQEPEKGYTSTVDLGRWPTQATPPLGRADRVMPFATVRILTGTTPDLEQSPALGSGPGRMFVPRVAGAPFPFKLVAADREGNLVEFSAPLVFMERGRNIPPHLDTGLNAYNGLEPADRRMPLRGQRIAFAASRTADDTALSTDALTFDTAPLPPSHAARQDDPQFLPILREARAVVPAMSALAGAANAVTLKYPTAYRTKGFTDNASEVFLELDGAAPMSFTGQGDRSGGFVTPNLDVTALSRLTGPIGGPVSDAVDGTVTADTFFAALDQAKLFGVVTLTDLLKGIGLDPAKIPTFVAQTLDAVTSLTQNVARIAEAATQLGTAVSTHAAALNTVAGTFVADLAGLVSGTATPDLEADLRAIVGTAGTPGPLPRFLADLAKADQLPRAQREQLQAVGQRIVDPLKDLNRVVGLLQSFARREIVPEVLTARLDWSTRIPAWGLPGVGTILAPVGTCTLSLAVEVQAPTTAGSEPSALVSCSITPFDLRLIGDRTFLILHFTRVEFSVAPGKKPDVNVEFRKNDGIEFAGPLRFVNTLRQIIPFDGFSDPPYLDVTSEGIKAGFDLGIPNLGVGIFSLENISLGAHFSVPFIGESLEVGFNFCTRENPFRLSVMLFGGGGFFGVTLTPDGVRVLEAAFEFGASISINLGVASGGVSVMAGIYFRIERRDGKENAFLTGYFRLRGEVSILGGIASASIELYLELTYETASGKAVGRATLTIEVEILFFSFSVSISCEKKFAGADGDPTFEQQMGALDASGVRAWDTYCGAFADD